MNREPKPMQEIHSIQERIYETCKNMSGKEKLVALHKEAEEAGIKYGLALRKASQVK